MSQEPDQHFPRSTFKVVLLLSSIGFAAGLGHTATVSSSVYSLPVGDSPASFVNGVLFDGRYIWSAVQNRDGGRLVKITQNGAILSSTVVGSSPDEMAYDGANIWLTDYTSSDVTIVSASGSLVKTIPLPSAKPEGIIFDGKYVWVANNGVGENSVTKFDAVSQTLVATYPVGLAPDGVAFDGTYIWVTNSYNNNVWKIDRDTGEFINSFTTGIFPVSIVYDGANMWVGNGSGVDVGAGVSSIGTVAKIRASDGAILGTYTVGNLVRGLVYDGTSIWVCNGNDNTVSRLRADGVALLGTYSTGRAPRAVAFDGSKIWVANSGSNTLTIIAPQVTGANTSAPDLTAGREFGRVNASGSAAAGSPHARKPLPHGADGLTPTIVTQRDVVLPTSLGSMLDLILDPN